MKNQDAVDLLTPLILIPAYWLLFQVHPGGKSGPRETLAFMVLAALWVEGQGIHLAANSIGHLTEAFTGSDAAALTYFYDEVLSHWMWHAGIIGLSLLLIFRQWRNPFAGMRSTLRAEIGAGLLHGLSFGLMTLEGATVALGLPSAAAVVIFVLARGRTQLREQPVLAFFFVAYLTAAILFVSGVYTGDASSSPSTCFKAAAAEIGPEPRTTQSVHVQFHCGEGPMPMDQSFVQLNRAATERLRRLVNGLTGRPAPSARWRALDGGCVPGTSGLLGPARDVRHGDDAQGRKGLHSQHRHLCERPLAPAVGSHTAA